VLTFHTDHDRNDICSASDLTTRLLCDDSIRGIQERASNPEDLRRYLDLSIQRCVRRSADSRPAKQVVGLRSFSSTARVTGTRSQNAPAQSTRRHLPLLPGPNPDQDMSQMESALLSPQDQAASLSAQMQMSLRPGSAQPEVSTRASRYRPFPESFPFHSSQSSGGSFAYSALGSSVSDPDSAWGFSSHCSVRDGADNDTMSSAYSDIGNMREPFSSPSFNWDGHQAPQHSFGLTMDPLQQPTSTTQGSSTANLNSSRLNYFGYPNGAQGSQDIGTGNNRMMTQQSYQLDPTAGGFPTFRAGPDIVPIVGNTWQPEVRSQPSASVSIPLGDRDKSRGQNEGGPPGITEPMSD